MSTLNARFAAVASAVMLVAMALAACTSPSATPSPSLEPTPEPTPDVAGVFVAEVTSPDFEAVADVSGTLSVETEGITIEGTMEGEARFSGGDSSTSVVMDMAGMTQLTEEISVDGATYSSVDGGPFILSEADPEALDDESLTQMLSAIESLTDAGEVEHFGRTVHELEPTEDLGLDPAALGLTDPTMANEEMSMTFYAEPDGMPAGFSIALTWTQGLDGGTLAEAAVVIDIEFTDLESPVTIEAPDAVWVRWDAEGAPFTVAYPEEWTSEAAFGTLLMSPPDGSGYFSVTLSDPPLEQESQAAFSVASNAAVVALGATASGSQPYEVGTVSSTLVAYRNAFADPNSLLLHLPLFDGTYGYEIQLATIASPEEESLVQDMFDTFMSTFDFTR